MFRECIFESAGRRRGHEEEETSIISTRFDMSGQDDRPSAGWHSKCTARSDKAPRRNWGKNSLVDLIQHNEELDVYVDWQTSSEDLPVEIMRQYQ